MKIYEVCKTENQLGDIAIISRALFEDVEAAKVMCHNMAHNGDVILLKVLPLELFNDPAAEFDFLRKEAGSDIDRCIFIRERKLLGDPLKD